jgi:hypothetical protein
MAESKYGKYIARATAETPSDMPGVLTSALGEPKDWAGIQHRIKWHYITQPVLMEEEPHSHDFDEFLCFLGSNPLDPKDFGAEIEVSMGEEGEKQVINTRSVVCIPKGTVHSSVNFKKIDKPVLYCYIYMSPEYKKKPVS